MTTRFVSIGRGLGLSWQERLHSKVTTDSATVVEIRHARWRDSSDFLQHLPRAQHWSESHMAWHETPRCQLSMSYLQGRGRHGEMMAGFALAPAQHGSLSYLIADGASMFRRERARTKFD